MLQKQPIYPTDITEEEYSNGKSKVAHKDLYKSYLNLTEIDDSFQLKTNKDSMRTPE